MQVDYKMTIYFQYLVSLIIFSIVAGFDLLIMVIMNILFNSLIGSIIAYSVSCKIISFEEDAAKEMALQFTRISIYASVLMYLLFMALNFKDFVLSELIAVSAITFVFVIIIKYLFYHKFLIELRRFFDHQNNNKQS